MIIPQLDVQASVVLAPYTTYKIGGPADYFVEVLSLDELVTAIKSAREQNVLYFILGTGANILILDGGFRGLAIHNLANKAEIKGQKLTAGSGAVIADLIDMTAKHNLSGLEHFAGIPSSVGGAMRQNLHFLSPERDRTLFIAEIVESAEILNEHNQRRVVDRDYFQFGYDDSILHHNKDIVLSVTFSLIPKLEIEIRAQAEANLAWRRAKQPQLEDWPSCGSVFKKIADVGAGRLIDQVGLKGKHLGGAQISPQHANFIVNTGGATAKDVLDLVDLATKTVKAETDHELIMEIGLVGEA